jgi:hypothetical protein
MISNKFDSHDELGIMTPEEVAQYLRKSISWVYKNWRVLERMSMELPHCGLFSLTKYSLFVIDSLSLSMFLSIQCSVAPPGNQAANRENKHQPIVSEETGLLDSFSFGSERTN